MSSACDVSEAPRSMFSSEVMMNADAARFASVPLGTRLEGLSYYGRATVTKNALLKVTVFPRTVNTSLTKVNHTTMAIAYMMLDCFYTTSDANYAALFVKTRSFDTKNRLHQEVAHGD